MPDTPNTMADSEPTTMRQPSPENDASDDGEPAMVVTRARRSNAGNWMRKLLDQEERHEENPEMLEFYGGEGWAELADDEEFGAYGVEDEGDIALESSGDEDEDEGANDEDDTGEKVVRKEEREQRAAQRKKRKDPFAASALRQKRTKTGTGPSAAAAPGSMAPPPRPKKKSERVSWLPEVPVGPVRSSSRQLSVQNRQMIAQSLEEKERHRLEVLETMRQAEQRKEQGQPKPMTQEERLVEAARVEKRNSKTLSRWEESERRKAEENKARLEALKNRKLDGAFIRYYSGPSIWVNDKLKYVGKENCKIEDLDLLKEEPVAADATLTPVKAEVSGGNTPQVDAASNQDQASSGDQEQTSSNQNQPQTQPQPPPADTTSTEPPPPTTTTTDNTPSKPVDPKKSDSFAAPLTTVHQSFGNSIMFPPPEATPGSFLDGILDWASRDPANIPNAGASEPPQSPRRTSAPAATPTTPANKSSQEGRGQAALPHRPEPSSAPPSQPTQQQHSGTDSAPAPQVTTTTTTTTPTPTAADTDTPQPAATAAPTPTPAPAPAALAKCTIQRAARNLITLETPDTSTIHANPNPTRDKATLTRTLLSWPASAPTTLPPYPHLPPGTRPGRGSRSHLLHPPRAQCVITAQPARYRDPLTGLAYADAYAFKGLRRFVRDGTARWSALLGCFVGAREGRWAVAKGVPKGFAAAEVGAAEAEAAAGEGAVGEAGGVSAGVGAGATGAPAGGVGKEGEAKEAVVAAVALDGAKDESRAAAEPVAG